MGTKLLADRRAFTFFCTVFLRRRDSMKPYHMCTTVAHAPAACEPCARGDMARKMAREAVKLCSSTPALKLKATRQQSCPAKFVFRVC